MSYDLYLTPKEFDLDAVRAHFVARAHFTVDDRQAHYHNDDTGVYFHVETVLEASSPDDNRAGPYVWFNVNFYRPHTFGLEAAIEILAFLERFESRIDDPQIDEPAEGAYMDHFLRAWNNGNAFGFQSIGSQEKTAGPSADPEVIEAAWRWNYGRASLQKKIGPHLFVPKIVWLQPEPNAVPVPSVTWTFGVATLIPEGLVNHVVLVRQQRPSLMKIFSRSADRKYEFKLLNIQYGIKIRGIERSEVDGRPVWFTPSTGSLEMQALFSGDWPAHAFKLLEPEAVSGVDLAALAGKV